MHGQDDEDRERGARPQDDGRASLGLDPSPPCRLPPCLCQPQPEGSWDRLSPPQCKCATTCNVKRDCMKLADRTRALLQKAKKAGANAKSYKASADISYKVCAANLKKSTAS